MRRLDDNLIDPEVAASLDAIDAALEGEPVDPAYSELAELAVLLAADRPAMSSAFAGSLDARVERRFAPRAPRRSWRLVTSLFGASATVAAVIAVIAVVLPGVRGSSSASSSSSSSTTPAVSSSSGTARSPASSSTTASSAAAASLPAPAVSVPGTGRQIVQSAQLQLSTAPDRIDQVAQEAFDVIGAQHGTVDSSTVTQTGGSDGYANLELSVPSSALAQTMAQLSRLSHAQVASRMDTTQDVTNQFNGATQRLADARALRTALLKQLAGATTTQQIASLKAQIRDAEASIGSAQAALRSLGHQVNFTHISLAINAGAAPVPAATGFTIGKAAHDAGRVLVLAAGVALIVLAGLVPLGLLAGLAWWIASAVRRHRREQALDLA